MDILDLIGNTPLVEVTGIDTGLCRLFVKLENQNPGGSIKDRIAISMILDAEKTGKLKPGGTIVEATAGNTGLGLALVAARRGYPLHLVLPDKMSREKINQLRALGAQVTLTRSDVNRGHPDYYQDKARALAASIPGAWLVDQFSNPANPLAHEHTTGPEIWEQMEHNVDAVVVGVGSGGTLGGLTHFFERTAPQVAMVIGDPEGSIIASYIKTGIVSDTSGSWLVEGIGEDFLPDNASFSLVKAAYTISDKESFLAARELLRTNGIMGGSSTGTLLAAALRYCREQTKPKRVVTLVCDNGSRYLSKMYSDVWMVENGFLPSKHYGDLRDLISHHLGDGTVISVTPTDNLRTAYSRMKLYDVSQLPVLEGEKIVGVLDESDLLFALHADVASLKRPVKETMTTKLKTLRPSDSFDHALRILQKGLVAIIADENRFYGIITKIDAVTYLRYSR